MDAPELPMPKAPKKKKVVTKPRTKGRDRQGGDDTKAEVAARKEIPMTNIITLEKFENGTTRLDTAHIDCVPRLVMGARMSMLQMEEYLGICGIIPKRTDYPEEDPNLGRGYIHKIDWTKGGLDAKLYGDKPAFEGLSHVQVLHHIAAVLDLNRKTINRLGVIVDNKDYLYVGIIPSRKYIGENTDSKGFMEYKYRDVMEFDIMELERMQRIMYRIPIDDKLLDTSQKKTLSDIRNGKLEKLPHFYVVERPAEVFKLSC